MLRWVPQVPSQHIDYVKQIAESEFARLSDLGGFDRCLARASYSWRGRGCKPDFSLSRGYSGLAIAYSYLHKCFNGAAWDTIAHRYLLRAIEIAEDDGAATLGLFAGLS